MTPTRPDAFEPGRVQLLGPVDQVARHARLGRDLAQPVRVRAVLRADHQHEVDVPRELAHRALPVLGGVADVVGVRPDHGREALAQPPDHLARVVDAERGLGDEGDALGVGELEPVDVPGRGDEVDAPVDVADRALDLGVAGVADQHDLAALPGVAPPLDVDLADERAGGVDDTRARGPRRPRRPAAATPCALKTTIPPAGTSSVSSTNTAPLARRSSTTARLWTISCRTWTGGPYSSSARSTDRDGAGHAGAEAARLGKDHPQPRPVARRRRCPAGSARCRPHGPYQNVSGR